MMANFLNAILTRFGKGSHTSASLIPRIQVRRAITDAIDPILQAQGFERFVDGRSLRVREKWTDLVEVRFTEALGLPANSPSMHIGRHLNFVPEDAISGPMPQKDGRPFLTEARCHLRKTLFKAIRQRETSSPDVWFIGGSADNLAACVAEVMVAMEQEVIPWFGKLDKLETLLDIFISGQPDIEGKLADRVMRGTWNFANYFSRHVAAGFVALELGHRETAAGLLGTVLCDGGVVGKDGRVFALPPTTMTLIREAVETAQR